MACCCLLWAISIAIAIPTIPQSSLLDQQSPQHDEIQDDDEDEEMDDDYELSSEELPEGELDDD